MCAADFCSTADFSTDATGAFAIDRLQLFVDGTFAVTNGTLTEVIDGGRVETYRQAMGSMSTIRGVVYYTIPAGEARFIFVGEADDEIATLPATNSTNIVATYTSGIWSVQSFDIEYVDDSSDTWTLTIDAADWL